MNAKYTWRFLNTRPAERAGALTDGLTASGVSVRDMPLLEIVHQTLSQDETDFLKQLATYDCVICVSPTAAELALKMCDELGMTVTHDSLANLAWVAVGQRTADVLAQAGLKASIPEHSSNEGMLTMPDIAKLTADTRVMIWRGEGGRRLLHDDLVARGVQVDSIAFYKRKKPIGLASGFARHQNWANVVLISSGEAWQHWQAICMQMSAYAYVVLGERVGEQVREQAQDVRVVEVLTADAVLAVLSR